MRREEVGDRGAGDAGSDHDDIDLRHGRAWK
jgi:hypothetical protein